MFVCTSTLAEWDTFVPTEDEAGVTNASLYTGLVAGATRSCRVLTARLGTGWATRGVLTARGTFQSWREKDILENTTLWFYLYLVQIIKKLIQQ